MPPPKGSTSLSCKMRFTGAVGGFSSVCLNAFLHSGGTLSGNEASACVMASGDNLTSLVSPSIIRLFYFAGRHFRSVVTVLDHGRQTADMIQILVCYINFAYVMGGNPDAR